MEAEYYVFGLTICRKYIKDEEVITEFYKVGEGWLQDKPGMPWFSNLGVHIQDALHDYGNYSVMDVDIISEETAMKITAKQEKLGRNDIPGLRYGSGAYKE